VSIDNHMAHQTGTRINRDMWPQGAKRADLSVVSNLSFRIDHGKRADIRHNLSLLFEKSMELLQY
jgi:hypothetical protein